MFSLVRQALTRLPAMVPTQIARQGGAMFHAFTKQSLAVGGSPLSAARPNLLQPFSPAVVPSCGFKVKGWLRRRCKDCYFVRRDQRLYVICKTHPRHKQMSMVPKEKNTWVLTCAMQSKVRPW